MASPVVWFQITGQDGAGLRTFYSELFGWRFDVQEYADYGFVAAPGEGIPGGVGKAENGPAGVTFYVGVEDQAAALAAAERLGGRAVMPPTPLPNGTSIAFFADPEGNVVGLSGGGTPNT
jgi:predicted enzyme related to lactoylglutathione lyase